MSNACVELFKALKLLQFVMPATGEKYYRKWKLDLGFFKTVQTARNKQTYLYLLNENEV
jgi:hypothetical protein